MRHRKVINMRKKGIGAILLACFFLMGMLFPLQKYALAANESSQDETSTAAQSSSVAEKPYLNGEEITAANNLMRERSSGLTDLLKFPPTLSQDELKNLIVTAQQDFKTPFVPRYNYDAKGKPIKQKMYQPVKDNCNLEAIPSTAYIRYAVTTERANMRFLPTDRNYFNDRDFRHYDELQGTALDPAEPVLVLWESKDRAFAFVRTRNFAGWTSLGTLAFTDREHWEHYANPENFLVVTAAQKQIRVKKKWQVLFQMGSIIPLRQAKQGSSHSWQIYIPVNNGGSLLEAKVTIRADDTVHLGYLPCTKENFVRQAMKFNGGKYSLGGLENGIDDASLAVAVYRSMGLEIPRTAKEQESSLPESFSFAGLSPEERWEAIKKAPAGALFFSPSHVMLYLGEDEDGSPLVIRAMGRYFSDPKNQGDPYDFREVFVSDLHYQRKSTAKLLANMTSIGFIK